MLILLFGQPKGQIRSLPVGCAQLFKRARTDKYYGLRRGRSSARLERRPVTSEVVGSNPIGPARLRCPRNPLPRGRNGTLNYETE